MTRLPVAAHGVCQQINLHGLTMLVNLDVIIKWCGVCDVSILRIDDDQVCLIHERGVSCDVCVYKSIHCTCTMSGLVIMMTNWSAIYCKGEQYHT